MKTDRVIQLYQGYTLAKISAFSKQQLIAQYAQCEAISNLEKSLAQELASIDSTTRKILENQIKEEKHREEIKFYRNRVYKVKEAVDIIHNTSDFNFKGFLLQVFAQPFSNIIKDAKNQLEEIPDKEFCDKWLDILNKDYSETSSNNDYLSSSWHEIVASEPDYTEKKNNLDLLNKEFNEKISAISKPQFKEPIPIDKNHKAPGKEVGCCFIVLFFILLGIVGSIGNESSFSYFAFWIVVALLITLYIVNTFISTAKKNKLWIDNYDKYVEAVQKDNERMQDEYDKQVGEFDTEKAELKEKEIRLNSHPYQLAISIVTDLIPDWQDVVNKIAQLLPKIEENNMGEAEDEKWDPLLKEAARLVVIHQQGSTSLIQRHFSIGYNRAGRIMDQLEKINIVSAAIYSKPREVLAVDEEDLNYRFKEFNL
jgi:hypothetical protein